MQDIVFQQDVRKGEWKECHDTRFTDDDIALLPIVLLVRYSSERTGIKWEKAWCHNHQAYEAVLEYTDSGFVTETGCHLEGLTVPVSNNVYQSYYSYYDEPNTNVALRWRVRIQPDRETVYLIYDVADIFFAWKWEEEQKDFLPVPKATSRKSYSTVISLSMEAQSNLPRDTPSPVLHCAMKALLSKTDTIYGEQIQTPMFLSGKNEAQKPCSNQEALAFLHRPLDMNIFFFRKYFLPHSKHGDFDELFPPNQRENFLPLMEAFGLTPTDELRSAYEKNPLAVIFNMMLPELGITGRENIQKFYHLTSFCGKDMSVSYRNELFFDPLHQKTKDVKESEEQRDYENLRFYCLWRREQESEQELAEHLLSVQKDWRKWMYRSLEMFRKYFHNVSVSLRKEILRDGISADVHDHLAMLEQAFLQHHGDAPCGEKELSWECRINDYNFRLVNSINTFQEISRPTEFLFPSRSDLQGNVLFTVERNGRYIATLQIHDRIVEKFDIRDFRDPILGAKCRTACLAWFRHNGFEMKFALSEDCYRALNQELIVEPVDADAEWESMSLMDMLELPESSIRNGYYLHLYRKLAETGLLRRPAPSLADDEHTYLLEKFPLCNRIFKAAFEGNPEAQYVTSLCYRDGYIFAYNDLRLADIWYRRASANGWLKIAPAQKDIRIAEFSTDVNKDLF